MSRLWSPRAVPALLLSAFLLLRAGRVAQLLASGTMPERLSVLGSIALLVGLLWVARRGAPGWVERLLSTTDARVAAALLGIVVVLAAFAPIATGNLPFEQPDIIGARSLPPSFSHFFGTDQYSRDLFSRVIYGARVSLAIALVSVLVSVSIGSTVGLLAGYRRGWVDAVLMRIVDAGIAMPRLVLLLVVLALWGQVSVPALILVLGFTGWFGTSRLVRAEVLALRKADFVMAGRGLGLTESRIVFRHILPNVAAPIIVTATLAVGQMVLIEAGLSFLGFGVQEPMPSWGSIIADGRYLLTSAPWIATVPGAAIALTVTSIGILGDRLQLALNPREARSS